VMTLNASRTHGLMCGLVYLGPGLRRTADGSRAGDRARGLPLEAQLPAPREEAQSLPCKGPVGRVQEPRRRRLRLASR
jgi:hypothetical protein